MKHFYYYCCQILVRSFHHLVCLRLTMCWFFFLIQLLIVLVPFIRWVIFKYILNILGIGCETLYFLQFSFFIKQSLFRCSMHFCVVMNESQMCPLILTQQRWRADSHPHCRWVCRSSSSQLRPSWWKWSTNFTPPHCFQWGYKLSDPMGPIDTGVWVNRVLGYIPSYCFVLSYWYWVWKEVQLLTGLHWY